MYQKRLRVLGWRVMVSCSVGLASLLPAASMAHAGLPVTAPALPGAAVANTTTVHVVVPDSLFGRSGKLRFRLFSSTHVFALPILERLFGKRRRRVKPLFNLLARNLRKDPAFRHVCEIVGCQADEFCGQFT